MQLDTRLGSNKHHLSIPAPDRLSRALQVLAAAGVEWQSRMAVLTEEILAFSSIQGDTREYWPETSSVTLNNLRAVFDNADADNSGSLDVSEVRKCLGVLNVRNTCARECALQRWRDGQLPQLRLSLRSDSFTNSRCQTPRRQ